MKAVESNIHANRLVLIVSTLIGSWLGMQILHELGHAFGACITGGTVARVVLHPLAFSRTDLAENPHPLLVAWAGPVIGVLLPLVLWLIASAVRMPGTFVLRFFAGFCLIANGLYIGVGSFDRVGDCGTMLRHGSSPWQLWLFGVITTPIGLWLWHRQGRHFGLGRERQNVRQGVAIGTLLACLILFATGFAIGGE
jgi:hypothetical protein